MNCASTVPLSLPLCSASLRTANTSLTYSYFNQRRIIMTRGGACQIVG